MHRSDRSLAVLGEVDLALGHVPVHDEVLPEVVLFQLVFFALTGRLLDALLDHDLDSRSVIAVDVAVDLYAFHVEAVKLVGSVSGHFPLIVFRSTSNSREILFSAFAVDYFFLLAIALRLGIDADIAVDFVLGELRLIRVIYLVEPKVDEHTVLVTVWLLQIDFT